MPGGASEPKIRAVRPVGRDRHDEPEACDALQAQLETGMVIVNLPTAGVDFYVRFGGRKASSFGSREQGKYATEFFTVVKTAYTLA